MHENTYYIQQRILAMRESGPQSSSIKLQSVERVSLTLGEWAKPLSHHQQMFMGVLCKVMLLIYTTSCDTD